MTRNTSSNPVLLHSITLENLLSFGSHADPIELQSLNVIIGPNGSGKSNLIEAIVLLRSTSRDVRDAVRKGGGVNELIWKGASDQPAIIEAVVDNPKGKQPLRHVFAFRAEKQIFRLEDERIENEHAYSGEYTPYFYYNYFHGHPKAAVASGDYKLLAHEDVIPDESILVQRRDPETYPVITYINNVYEKIRIYREWQFGRNTIFRNPQQADLRNDRLEEDFSNLGLFLNKLRRSPRAKASILAGLKDLYQDFDDYDVSIEGGTVQVFFTEGDFTIPATRLSDGTIRYLSLLAILCDPNPPPLICIEEPELGLHPDILPKLADLLLDASQRTQLIVTTHSDIIVDALTGDPESVLICEKHEGQTHIKRLNAGNLKEWLQHYRLGELWIRGELGGTRW